MNTPRPRARRAGLAVLLSCAVLLPAQATAAIVDIAWSPDGRFVHQAQVAAGKFVELCGPLAQGEAVRWRYEASAPVDFNIHYHAGKDVVFPTRQAQVSAGRDILKVVVPQDYCWMWTNKGSVSVSLTVELQR